MTKTHYENLQTENCCYFYIYLARVGSQNDVNVAHQFSFLEFNLSGLGLVTPSPATSRRISKLNKGVSLMCSPSGLNDPNDPASPLYSVEDISETDKKFSYKVIDAGAAVNWDVFGRRLLCVLAVDAFPGEIIELGTLSGSVKFYNGNVCTLVFGGCDNDPIPSYQVLPPTACTGTGFLLRQGTAQSAPIAGYPNRKKIPVYVYSQPGATYNLQQLNFLMKIEAPTLMAGVILEPGQILAEELVLYDETTGPNTNKRVFADYRNVSINATNTATPANTLFNIILDGPQLSSDCGTTTVTFTENRRMLLAPNGSCCQPGVLGVPQLVEWNTQPCPGQCTNLTVTAKEASSIPSNADPCYSLFFDVDMLSLINIIYPEAKIRVEIKHSGSITWKPALSFSAYCSNLNSCVTAVQISPGLLQLTFDIDGGTSINLSSTQPQNLIRFGFDAIDACIEGVVFRDAIFTAENAATPCLPKTVSEIKNAVPADIVDDICITSLTMTYELHFGPLMESVGYRVGDDDPILPMDPITCEVQGQSDDQANGSTPICACYLPNQAQWVYPSKNDNPLNGVTTFDLVLISKHILGIEPLVSPYKIIAADATGTGSVTTFDIVELRKLILGIYGQPGSPWPYHSYRFVNKALQLPANPLPLPLSSQTVQVSIPPLGAVAAFYGIKVGDVNNTALGANFLSNDDRTETTAPIGFVVQAGKKGEIIRIPVFAQEAIDCNGWQIGIGYDPLQWKLTNVVWTSQMGEMPEQFWHQLSPGNLRLLGYNGMGDLVRLPKGTPLFYLEGELLQAASTISIWLDDKVADFTSETYGTSGDRGVFALRSASESQMVQPPSANTIPPKDAWSVDIYPNPAGKAFRIQLMAPAGGAGSIKFFNPLGQLVTEHSVGLAAGENIFTSANLPMLQAGQYMVKIDTPWGQKSLRLVKN